MSSKRKGTRFERELAHMFFDHNWGCVRVAGSGSTPMPAPDILASNGKRVLAVECKGIKKTTKYLSNEDVEQLKKFSKKFGAEAWLGIRFDAIGWYFLELKDLKKSKKGYVIPLNLAKKDGLSFKELIGVYRQKRLR